MDKIKVRIIIIGMFILFMGISSYLMVKMNSIEKDIQVNSQIIQQWNISVPQ